MKKQIKKIVMYFAIFILIVMGLVLTLVGTAKIPRQWIEKNIEDSSQYLSKNTEINYIKRKHPFMYLHIYADEVLLNIIYNINTETPLQAIIEAKHYQNGMGSLKQQMENKNLEANTEYMRYWHGSMVFVRPLLALLNIHGIYIINMIVLLVLMGILLFLLWKKKQKALLISVIVAFFMTGSIFVPFCLEYVWTYFIMLITSIIAIIIEKQGNRTLQLLFFITGITTCFLDFLSTEIITILVPLLLVFGIRYQEKRVKKIKDEIKEIIVFMLIWLVGYVGMWFAKWIIASVVLQVNAFDYVLDKAFIRVNGEVLRTTQQQILIGAIERNIMAIFPLNLIKNPYVLGSMPIVLIILFLIFKKEKRELTYMIPLLIIAIVPYVRYVVLANHSYLHYFFTFRSQFPVIMAIILTFVHGVDMKKMNQQIQIKQLTRKNR